MASDPAPSHHPVLQIVRDHKARSFPLTARITFGRGEEADIRIADDRVSRLHCRVEPLPGQGVKITDLGSSNGTLVNGREISQVVLRDGDVAQVGDAELTVVEIGEARPAVPSEGGAAPPPHGARRAAGPPPVRASVPTPTAETPEVGSRKRRRVRELPTAAAPAPASSPASAPASSPAPALSRSDDGASSRAPAAAKTNYVPMVFLGLGIVAMITIVLTLGGEDQVAIARMMAREADALETEGEIGEALAKLEDMRARYPETPAAEAAPPAIARLEERLEQHREGVTRLAMVLRDSQIGSLGMMEARLREVGGRYSPGVRPSDIAAKIDEARRVFADRASRHVAGIRTQALALLASHAYGKALGLLSDAEASGRVSGQAVVKLAAVREMVNRRARQQFGDLLRTVKSMTAPRALMALNQAAMHFHGTPHAGELRARASLLEADIARAKDAVIVAAEDDSEPKPAAAPEEDLLRALSRAEHLVSRRAYAAAVPAFEEALGHAGVGDREQLERRIVRVRAMADVVDAIINAVKTEPGAFRQFRLGSTLVGRVTSATRERVTLTLPGAEVRWNWARLTPERFRRLAIRSGLEGRASVEAGTVLIDMGAPELALGLLARRFDKEINLRARLQDLAAEARGLDSVPPGGFHVRDGKLLTTEEFEEAVLVAKLDGLEAAVRDAGPSLWMADADALRGLGERGNDRLAAALEARLGSFAESLEAVPALSKKRVGALRQRLLADLKVRRRAALTLIFDTVRYKYPYGPNKKAVQAEVDGLVAKVSEIWATPSARLVADDAELTALLTDARSVATALESMGKEVAGPEKLLRLIDERIDMRHFDGGAGVVEHWKAVIAHNDGLLADGHMTQPERDCYTGTNEYRVMMGLRAVMGDPALIRCARGHSQEMKDLGYFNHSSPTPGRRSPGQRAKLAGWGGGVSENIARGRADGFAVVRQWRGSSGHHRNILGRGHTHLGAGKSKEGSFWTQNFGRGRSRPPRKK